MIDEQWVEVELPKEEHNGEIDYEKFQNDFELRTTWYVPYYTDSLVNHKKHACVGTKNIFNFIYIHVFIFYF